MVVSSLNELMRERPRWEEIEPVPVGVEGGDSPLALRNSRVWYA